MSWAYDTKKEEVQENFWDNTKYLWIETSPSIFNFSLPLKVFRVDKLMFPERKNITEKS